MLSGACAIRVSIRETEVSKVAERTSQTFTVSYTKFFGCCITRSVLTAFTVLTSLSLKYWRFIPICCTWLVSPRSTVLWKRFFLWYSSWFFQFRHSTLPLLKMGVFPEATPAKGFIVSHVLERKSKVSLGLVWLPFLISFRSLPKCCTN